MIITMLVTMALSYILVIRSDEHFLLMYSDFHTSQSGKTPSTEHMSLHLWIGIIGLGHALCHIVRNCYTPPCRMHCALDSSILVENQGEQLCCQVEEKN